MFKQSSSSQYWLIIESVQYIIFQVIRNPLDALVSWYHFYQDNHAYGYYKGSWEEFFTMVIRF